MKAAAILAFLIVSVASAQTLPCPSAACVYVLNADKWDAMHATYADKIIPGHMKSGGGAGIIAIFSQGESADRLPSDRPTFCIVGPAKASLLSLQARGKERRVIVAKSANWKGAYASHQRWFSPDSVVAVSESKNDNALMITPQIPLRNGEYALITNMPEAIPGGRNIDPHLVKAYDFGYFSR
jgi:hypothetical protein